MRISWTYVDSMPIRFFFIVILAIWLTCGYGEDLKYESWALELFRAMESGPIDGVSSIISEIDLAAAKKVQKSFVLLELANKTIGGYKAGFTNSLSQKKWGLSEPVSGVLYSEGKRLSPSRIDIVSFQKLMIEIEIGFEIKKDITQKVLSLEDLIPYIESVLPVIELPDLAFNSLKSLTAVDLVATNIASAIWLVGKPSSVETFQALGGFDVILSLNSETIDSGKLSNAMGNPLEALLWLVNDRVRSGWPIKAGQILITGTLGRINAGRVGCYVGDYGPLGKVQLEVYDSSTNVNPCLFQL
jgi:2-keto-4-pentenoate hydratase